MAVKIRYRLARPCGNIRKFCRNCVNTFAIDQCGPIPCAEWPISQIPSRLCLHPFVSGDTYTDACSACKDDTIASKYLAYITYAPNEFNPEGRTIGPYELPFVEGGGSCESSVVFHLPDDPSDGICSGGHYIFFSLVLMLVQVGCYGFHTHENFFLNPLESGPDCLKIMNWISVGGEPEAGPPFPPTGNSVMLIPIGENLPLED